MRADHSALIAQLRAARVGSATLSAQIVNAVGGEAALTRDGWRSRRLWWTTWSGPGNSWHALPHLTTDTDAALNFLEGLLPGTSWRISRTELGGHVQVTLGRSHPANSRHDVEGHSRALTLCVAAIEAWMVWRA